MEPSVLGMFEKQSVSACWPLKNWKRRCLLLVPIERSGQSLSNPGYRLSWGLLEHGRQKGAENWPEKLGQWTAGLLGGSTSKSRRWCERGTLRLLTSSTVSVSSHRARTDKRSPERSSELVYQLHVKSGESVLVLRGSEREINLQRRTVERAIISLRSGLGG